MMGRRNLLLCFLGLMAGFVVSTMAQEHMKSQTKSNSSADASAGTANAIATHDGASPASARDAATDERIARVEGEKRFRTNCGRCHMAPHKFPPRVMAAAIRHMRVRAMITDEDMRLILRYMTQ
jgi:mono/diheme cytochrome c family protein